MEKLSKMVFVTDGKRVGYILDFAIVDWQRVGYYVVDDETEEEFLLKNEDILALQNDFVLIEDVASLEFVTNRANLRGKQVLDMLGNDYGFVQNFVFNKNKCEKIVTDRCEIATKLIQTIGRDCLIISSKKMKKPQKHPPFPKSQADFVIKAMEEPKFTLPEKVSLSPSFYLGKICTKDIYGYNNERIISKGSKVTKAILEKAKLHNKLNQLFFLIER